MAGSMRIAFLGTPEFTLPLLEACARAGELVAVFAQPDRAQGRSSALLAPPSKRWALERGLPVHQPEKVKNGKLAALLAGHAPDLAVVAAYGRILPADALATPRLGCLNVHASLLPELRGAAPAQWAIARGSSQTGVTIMQMDEGLDTGDIRLQRALTIAPDETGETLLLKLGGLGALLLAEALARLGKGELQRIPQDHARATLAPILSRDDGRIDFARTALECDQRRRGFTPWPGAWTTFQGRLIKVHAAVPLQAQALAQAQASDQAQPPGTVRAASAEGLDLACGNGTIWRLTELQPEGKKRMSAGAFLQGNKLLAGQLFGA